MEYIQFSQKVLDEKCQEKSVTRIIREGLVNN